jgi:citrate lyase beta subunit
MNETFTEFLNEMQADPDMIQQALRMYLSERTNDLTRREMVTELRAAATSEEELDRLLKQLEHNPDALEQAALVYFEHAWADDTQRPSIRAAFQYAKGRLPVVEMAILAVVVMYGMYLIATDGVTEIRVKRNPDRSYEKTEKREPFAPIVSAVAQLFRKKG